MLLLKSEGFYRRKISVSSPNKPPSSFIFPEPYWTSEAFALKEKTENNNKIEEIGNKSFINKMPKNNLWDYKIF
jgi:hypothetical protein